MKIPQVHKNLIKQAKTVQIPVLVTLKMIRLVLVNHHQKVSWTPEFRIADPKNVNVEALVLVNLKRNLKNIKKKNHINQVISTTQNQSIKTITKDPKKQNLKREMIITTNTSLGVGTTISRTKISTEMSLTKTGQKNAPSVLVPLAMNRVPVVGKVEIGPKTDLVGGIRGLTIGIGLMIGRVETTTSMIGMNDLGTTAMTATPAIADEQQVTNNTGGIFYLHYKKLCTFNHIF